MKKIVVVGGGSAGWMSALFAQKLFPDSKVTLIESSSIDIIGVGESTTPPIISLFEFIDVSIADLVINVGATFKSSIKFTNWNGDGQHYFHGYRATDPEINFYSHSKMSPYSDNDLPFYSTKSFMAIHDLFHKENLDDIHASSVMSKYNRVPLSYNREYEKYPPIFRFDRHAEFALHFNARLLVEYLRKIGVERGIELIDGIVETSNSDENGFIQSLQLNENRQIECDFVFDCTGMARIFSEKHFKSNFKSYASHLPVKKAIPFFVENKGKTPVYTEAVSMKYGWMWKIPVEGRFGCGYVFDSDYINSDQAYEEASQMFDQEIVVPKVISFTPGYFTTPWNKNVLSVGLSSGFVEPLEATSIWITTMSLFLFAENLSGAVMKDQKCVDEYNKEFIRNTDSILNLVFTHYVNQRTDTDFWKEFTSKNKLPTSLQSVFDILDYRLLSGKDRHLLNLFSEESWLVVCAGNKLLPRDIIEKEYQVYNIENNLRNKIDRFKFKLDSITRKCIDHDLLLSYLRKHGNG
jgi:tryptophan halogenase